MADLLRDQALLEAMFRVGGGGGGGGGAILILIMEQFREQGYRSCRVGC